MQGTKATIIRKLYLVGIKKGLLDLPKKVVGTMNQFADQLSDTKLNKECIKKILYELEKEGIFESAGIDLYRINEQKLMEILSQDELFCLDQQILERKHVLIKR